MATRDRGFTLIELIVSVTIMTLIAGATLACFQAGSRAWGKARARSEVFQGARVVLRLMTQDLQGAVRSHQDGSGSFVGLDREWEGLHADTVDFAAIRPVAHGGRWAPPASVAPVSDRHEMGYFIDNNPDTPARGLIRRIDHTPDDDDFEGGRFEQVGPFVKELNLEYYDGLAWYDAWGPDEGVPSLVRITLVVDPEGVERPRAFTATVYLPMAGVEYGLPVEAEPEAAKAAESAEE